MSKIADIDEIADHAAELARGGSMSYPVAAINALKFYGHAIPTPQEISAVTSNLGKRNPRKPQEPTTSQKPHVSQAWIDADKKKNSWLQ